MTASTLTLAEFLLARIAEDEALAVAAVHPERPGTHWQWVNSETDKVVAAPTWDDSPSLRTVEEFPTTSGVGDLPAFVINHAEADEPIALPHIVRWDPARVLAECEAKRRIVDSHRWYQENAGRGTLSIDAMLLAEGHARRVAEVYADHPDFRQEWRA